ncbi:MerR family transcriptional regulator [Nocardia sp. NPDC024068]|uniref:MerR family transcriptional regulator n=1 Tax=Nocardia sp. NPDC024068 TaxID=3157197 RepID=UPI003402D665
MAELSRESGIPIATIKFYQREGLLPPGELTSPNQARYGPAHLRRLALVRALINIGGLSVSGIRDVLAAMGEPDTAPHDILGVAQHGLPQAPPAAADDTARSWAAGRVAEVVAELGWRPPPGSPLVAALIETVCMYRALGHEWAVEALPVYAAAAQRIARADIDALAAAPSTEDLVEGAVVGTVLGDALMATLRRVAHAETSRERFGQLTSGGPADPPEPTVR